MFKWLQRLWWARQRQIDTTILWPCIKEQLGSDLPLAHEIFFAHAFNDPCWTEVYGEKLWPTIQQMR